MLIPGGGGLTVVVNIVFVDLPAGAQVSGDSGDLRQRVRDVGVHVYQLPVGTVVRAAQISHGMLQITGEDKKCYMITSMSYNTCRAY